MNLFLCIYTSHWFCFPAESWQTHLLMSSLERATSSLELDWGMASLLVRRCFPWSHAINSSGIWSVNCPDHFLGQLCNSSQLRFPAGTTSTKWAASTGRAMMMPLMGFCEARVSCLPAPGQGLMCLLLCVISHHLQTLCERSVLSFSFSPRVPLLRSRLLSGDQPPAGLALCSPFLSLSLSLDCTNTTRHCQIPSRWQDKSL